MINMDAHSPTYSPWREQQARAVESGRSRRSGPLKGENCLSGVIELGFTPELATGDEAPLSGAIELGFTWERAAAG